MAPQDSLAAAGSSTYSSNTMYVGDGTWDATKNDFLLPNLVGLNFATMRYNGMGNRFSSMTGYHKLILGHGIIAAIVFLGLVPAAILIARFYGRSPGWALRLHIYLQILSVGLTTVVFILGWFAVGPERSLTNPHHGIGLAIYVLVLVQALGGGWIHRKEKGRIRRLIPVKLMLHQWLGRAIALLGIAQVPLGLTVYGSPKPLFIVYALWMAFLIFVYFVLSYRAQTPLDMVGYSHGEGETIISERKPSRLETLAAPLAAGVGIAALSGLRRDRHRSRSRRRSVEEVIPSRRGSGSYVKEEKYDRRKEGGGIMDKLLTGAAVLGIGALGKSFLDRRRRRRDDDDYSSVDPDSPSRRGGRRRDSVSDFTDDDVEVHRMEEGRPPMGPIAPVPVARPRTPNNPTAQAAAYSAADFRPMNTGRRDSYSSYTSYMTSPARSPRKNRLGKALGAGVLAGGLGSYFKNRRDRKEQERVEGIRAQEIEAERIARRNSRKYTGDQFPLGRHGRRGDLTASSPSNPNSEFVDSQLEPTRRNSRSGLPGGAVPAAIAGAALGAAAARPRSRSRQSARDRVAMAPESSGYDSESYLSNPRPQRHSSHRRKEEAAAAATAGGIASNATSRREDESVGSPPVSVKVQMHGDKNRNVTLRRLTEEEAAAERAARKAGHRRRRADSASSVSGTDTLSSRRRYRREESRRRNGNPNVEGADIGMAPLSPPNPAFAKGKVPKDSAYYSTDAGRVASPGSGVTWSAMSPGSEEADERRRRRRAERSQRGLGSVEYN